MATIQPDWWWLGIETDDTLVGTEENDTIFGYEGDDILFGWDGTDFLMGGDGRDTLYGEDDPDALWGDAGADELFGGSGADDLFGGSGGDLLSGGSGDDRLHGDTGADRMHGGSGVDRADYADSSAGITVDLRSTGPQSGGHAEGDTFDSVENVFASAHADRLTGSAEANRLEGRGGNDIIDGGLGYDVLDGGNGTDTLSLASWNSIDVSTGQETFVILPAAYADFGFVERSGPASSFGFPSLTYGKGGGGTALLERDVVMGFENVDGSHFRDVIQGNEQANVLNGFGGADELLGGAGNDTLNGGAAADVLAGGTGRDTLTGGSGGDTFVFASTGESGTTPTTMDVITDFSASSTTEVIDLTGIDADGLANNGDTAFFFSEEAGFSGQRGELIAVSFFDSATGASGTLVYGDVNGDETPDFGMRLDGVFFDAVSAGDFIL